MLALGVGKNYACRWYWFPQDARGTGCNNMHWRQAGRAATAGMVLGVCTLLRPVLLHGSLRMVLHGVRPVADATNMLAFGTSLTVLALT